LIIKFLLSSANPLRDSIYNYDKVYLMASYPSFSDIDLFMLLSLLAVAYPLTKIDSAIAI
jgi:hypothetical protein